MISRFAATQSICLPLVESMQRSHMDNVQSRCTMNDKDHARHKSRTAI